MTLCQKLWYFYPGQHQFYNPRSNVDVVIPDGLDEFQADEHGEVHLHITRPADRDDEDGRRWFNSYEAGKKACT